MSGPSLALFCIPKPFLGPIGVIQRNAIRSWRLLPGCEVLVLGAEPGAEAAARELGARHEGGVACNACGTPLVGDLFRRAHAATSADLLVYVNADIVLLDDFVPAARACAGAFRRFLMVGRRTDLEVREPLDFAPGWEGALRARARAEGVLHAPTGIDYFVFTRGLWSDAIPPFAIGRTCWDNWLLYAARSRGAPLIDATGAVEALHQNHGYAHVAGGEREVWEGEEARGNRDLAGGTERHFTIDDATHRLAGGRPRRCWDRGHLRRRLDASCALHPRWRLPLRAAGRLYRAWEWLAPRSTGGARA